jgi:hypothetical protein
LFLKEGQKEDKSGRPRTRVVSVETEAKQENNRDELASAVKEAKFLRCP